MERRTVYLLMLLTGLAEIALLATIILDTVHFYLLIYVAAYGPALALMVICFLSRVRMGTAPGTPDQVLSTMALNFRIAQYRVTDKGRSIVVQGGSTYGIRVYAEASGSNSVVLVKSDPSPSGWGVLLIMFVFTRGFVAIPYSIYLFLKSQKFGLSVIPAMYRHPGEANIPEAPSKTKACLIDTLSEGYRLSSEAYESARSNYEDNIMIGACAGLVIFLLTLIGIAFASGGEFDSSSELPIALGISIAFALAVPLAVYAVLRKRSKPQLKSLKSWSDRMKAELASEVSQSGASERPISTFEVILDASKEVPGWLQIRRRSGLYRNPVVWLAIVYLGIIGSAYLLMWAIALDIGTTARVFVGATSLALIALAVATYMFWRKKQAAEARQISETWARRSAAVRQKMDKMLRNL